MFVVHLHHEGIPLSFILDVIKVAESHTRKTMADVFHAVLNKFGILEKVSKNALKYNVDSLDTIQLLVMTSNNAATNDAMINEVGELVPAFSGSCSRG